LHMLASEYSFLIFSPLFYRTKVAVIKNRYNKLF
jgi:hypothetical protein